MNKILIVDDNILNVQVLANVLASNNYEVEYALNGDEALSLIEEEEYNLVLLDVMMPDKNGYDVCTEIKNETTNENLPIIFITAKTDIDSLSKAFDVGGVDYITKPFNETELLKRVNTHVDLFNSKKKLKALNNTITKKNKKMTESIEYSTRIQKSSLPNADLFKSVVRHGFVLYFPRDKVSGDFYWVNKIDGYSIIVIADCTGHGIPGAMMSMLGLSLLNNIDFRAHEFNTSLILEELRVKVKEFTYQHTSNDSIDLGICIYSKQKNEIQFSGAKMPLIIYTGKKLNTEVNDRVIAYNSENDKKHLYFIKGDGNTVGYDSVEVKFTSYKYALSGDETFYLYSDGVVDQFGGKKGRKLMRAGLFKLIYKAIGLGSFEKQSEFFKNSLMEWKKHKNQLDDITFIGFSFNSNNS